MLQFLLIFFKLAIGLVVLISGTAGRETMVMRDTAWLKICNKGELLEVRSDTCSKGIWLNSSIALGCVCVNGVWILSNDYCDENAIVLVGKGHCFDITAQVRSLKLLGRGNDPFYPSVYTLPSSLDIYHEVFETLSPIIDTDSTVVIGINPVSSVKRSDELVCLKATTVAGKPVYIYNNGRRMVNQWKINSKECNFPEDFEIKVAFGEMFTSNKIVSGEKAKGDCSVDKCKAPDVKPEMLGKSLAGASTIPKLTKDGQLHYGRSAFANPVEVKAPFQVKPGSVNEEKLKCLQNRADITQDPKEYERETKEQTIRMMKAHLAPLLLDVPVIEPKLKELEYFKMMLRVVLNSCPGISMVFVPMVAHGFVRMFYRLLQETQEKFTLREDTDTDQYTRIIASLVECHNGTEEMTIIDAKDPVSQCFNATPYIKGEYQNGTKGAYINVTYEMPEFLRGDINKHDLAIEAVWKIVLGGHYRCAIHFNNNTGDFSHMMEKLQALFNPHIIKRWYNSFNALKIYEYIFQRVDLQWWITNIDDCVGALKNLSPVTEWLLRPKIPITENDLSQDRPKRSTPEQLKTVWNGKGYCLNDFLDPIRVLKHAAPGCPIK